MDKFCVFVYVLMRDASLKQRIPHQFSELFQREKSVHYTRVNTVLAGLSTTTGSGKYSVAAVSIPLIVSRGWAIGGGCSQGC